MLGNKIFKTGLANLIGNYKGKTHPLTAVLVRQGTVWNAASPGKDCYRLRKIVIMEIIGKQKAS